MAWYDQCPNRCTKGCVLLISILRDVLEQNAGGIG